MAGSRKHHIFDASKAAEKKISPPKFQKDGQKQQVAKKRQPQRHRKLAQIRKELGNLAKRTGQETRDVVAKMAGDSDERFGKRTDKLQKIDASHEFKESKSTEKSVSQPKAERSVRSFPASTCFVGGKNSAARSPQSQSLGGSNM